MAAGIIDKGLGLLLEWYQQYRRKKRFKDVNTVVAGINAAMGRLEVVQRGWSYGEFKEEDIKISIDGVCTVPDEIRSTLIEPNRPNWEAKQHRDNEQCGVRQIDVIHESDDPARRQSDAIHIVSHRYKYFDALGTHFEWLNGNNHPLLTKHFADARSDAHAQMMPTPLSVGVSLFCEDGRKLVLVERTRKLSAGGQIAAGLVFNAVGEGCALVDVDGSVDNKSRLSVFRTATRGLAEEMGLHQGEFGKLALHTLCWDRKMCDYKFFGYASASDMAFGEIQECWKHRASTREGEPFYFDVAGKAACDVAWHAIYDSIGWSYEARLCTLMSLLQLGYLTTSELHDTFKDQTPRRALVRNGLLRTPSDASSRIVSPSS